MKTLALSFAILFAAGAAFADPVEGVWKTQEDGGAYAHVTIAPCGPNFCGVISRTFKGAEEYQSEIIGKQLVIDMAPQGDGAYEGKVWRPSNDEIYYGTISLNGGSMALAGCVAGGLICSTRDIHRTPF